MALSEQNVILLAHSQLSKEFLALVERQNYDAYRAVTKSQQFVTDEEVTDGEVITLTAIRTCYSPLRPSEVFAAEFERYFLEEASDGAGGTDADRLFREVFASKHQSTLEHLSFTFLVEDVSRSLLAQLTRHRIGFSFSVQSQRFVKFGSQNQSGGFDHILPPKIGQNEAAKAVYETFMEQSQSLYDQLQALGIPSEDARMVLPNAATCNLTMTANLRSLLHFYSLRKSGSGAQWEIVNLAEALRTKVESVEPWTAAFFEQV